MNLNIIILHPPRSGLTLALFIYPLTSGRSPRASVRVQRSTPEDIRRRAPFYVSDWTEAFYPENLQLLGVG